MVTGLIGKKIDQTQKFLEDGTRIPVTVISVPNLPVVAVKTKSTSGYTAIQVAFGSKRKGTQAILGHVKKANLTKAPQYLKEIRLDKVNPLQDIAEDSLPQVGNSIKATDVLKPGDIVNVSGVSKGKGYAGVVKRHGFKGGPRTHGQSDRERAPGSIGQTTTPGRVYKGKRMSGHMGVANTTIKNLKVVDVTETEVLIKGLVPGAKNSLVSINKVGEQKKFIALLKPAVEEVAVVEDIKVDVEESPKETPVVEKTDELVQEEAK